MRADRFAIGLLWTIVVGCATPAGPATSLGNAGKQADGGAVGDAGTGTGTAADTGRGVPPADSATAGADTAGTPPTPGEPSVVKWYDQLATALCEKAAACKSTHYHYGSVALCKEVILSGMPVQRQALLVAKGNMVWNHDEAAACVKWAGAVCDALDLPPNADCINAVRGKALTNRACAGTSCKIGSCQTIGNCGACVSPVTESNQCKNTSYCEPGYVCAGGTCRQPGSQIALAGCSNDFDCKSELFCDKKQCAPRLGEGGACTATAKAPCKGGLVCRPNDAGASQCKPPGKQGEVCHQVKATAQQESECSTGLRCAFESELAKMSVPTGKCLPQSDFGQPCVSVFQCGAFALCLAGKCQPYPPADTVCGREPNIGSEGLCAKGAVCDEAANTCVAAPTSGKKCIDMTGCAPGHFCNGGVCKQLGGVGAPCDPGQTHCHPALLCDEDNICRELPACLPP